MDDDQLPIDRMVHVCTPAQQAMVATLQAQGWIASHIMEYPMGYLNVWMIAQHRATAHSARPYTHGYVTLAGDFKRYRPVRTVRIKDQPEWYEDHA